MSLFSNGADRAVIGFDAGWRASFLKETDGHPDRSGALTVGRNGHEAEIRISRSMEFRAPTFELSIDGLPQDDLHRIIQDRLVFVEIALGWRDLAKTGAEVLGAAVTSMFELGEGQLTPVIVGRILNVQKQAGTFLERTSFRGVGAGFHRLATSEAPQVQHRADETAPDLIARVVKDFIGAPEVHQAGGLPPIDQPQSPDPGHSILQAVHDLARRGHTAGDDRAIPVFFRVDVEANPVKEVLHVGHWDDPIGQSYDLDGSTGLAEVSPVLNERSATHRGNPFEPINHASLTYHLVLLGRPEIQVADVVTFAMDEPSGGSMLASLRSTVGLLDSKNGGDPEWEVVSVEHSIGQESGFVTTLQVAAHPSEANRKRFQEKSNAHAIASTVSNQRRAVEQRMWEVARVQAQYAFKKIEDGRTIHPQRRTLASGIEDSASPNRIVNSPLRDPSTPLRARPYLTPFAWGKAGLVVPHYPGTRVADLHYRGLTQEGVIAGCLWEEMNEPKAELGDWWLCLPVDVSQSDSVSNVREWKDTSGELTGAHDLVDGQGRRAIHVDGFRITVGRGNMPKVGERPKAPPAAQLEIRHEKNNARIIIDDQGNIEIATDGNITFSANKIEARVRESFEVL